MEWTNTYYPGPEATFYSPPPYSEPKCIFDYTNGDFYSYEDELWRPEQYVSNEVSDNENLMALSERVQQRANNLFNRGMYDMEEWKEILDILSGESIDSS